MIDDPIRALGGELPSLEREDLDPGLAEALAAGDPERFGELLEEPHPRVYSFRLLRPEALLRFGDAALERASRARELGIELVPPNGMHEYGFVLDGLGFRSLLADLMGRHLAPLLAHLYPDFGGRELDHHHGFLVEYARDRDEDLGFHVDDSEVTLNLCLGSRFEGGELYFRGLRCPRHMQSEPDPNEVFDFHHEPGVALLHAGMHRHGVDYHRGGLRRNLILWCRSSRQRGGPGADPNAPCPAWCGLHSG